MTAGGKRAGAGRPRVLGIVADVHITARVTNAHGELILRLGNGNISAGLRNLCDMINERAVPPTSPPLQSIAKPARLPFIPLETRSIHLRELARVESVNIERKKLYNAGRRYDHLI